MTTRNRPGNAMRDMRNAGPVGGDRYKSAPQAIGDGGHEAFEQFLEERIPKDVAQYPEVRHQMMRGDAERALDILAKEYPTDGGLEWVESLARDLGVRAPWERDDSEWSSFQRGQEPPGWKPYQRTR